MENLDFEKHPFSAVAWTSDPSIHALPNGDGGEIVAAFVIDLATLTVPKNPCVVDYNHDPAQVVGSASVRVEDGDLIAEGFLLSQGGDLAGRIAASANDIPYGISPTLDLSNAERIDVPEGETFDCNGRTYPGPIFIYRNVALLGISICPYPTDENTSITVLNKGRVALTCDRSGLTLLDRDDRDEEEEPTEPTAEEPAEAPTSQNEEPEETSPTPVEEPTTSNEEPVEEPTEPDEEPTDDEDEDDKEKTRSELKAKRVKNEELQFFLDKFGLEGVRYYQDGKTLDEALAEEFEKLKNENVELRKLVKGFFKGIADSAPQETPIQLNGGYADAFQRRLAQLSQKSAVTPQRRGDAIGLSESVAADGPKTYRDAFIESIARLKR